MLAGPLAAVATAPQPLIRPNNRLSFPREFDNGAWTKGATVTSGMANVAVAPDGSLTADKIVPTSSSAAHLTGRLAITLAAGTLCTLEVYAKPLGYNFIALEIHDGSLGAGHSSLLTFNVATGAIGTNYSDAPLGASISPAPNGYFRCSITRANPTTSCNPGIFVRDSDANPRTNWAGDNASGVLLWNGALYY